jgi:dienelactone hydrolase
MSKQILYCLLPIAFSTLASSTASGQDQPSKHEEVARTFVQHLAASRFEEAVKPFDETMLKALPPAKLEEVWKGLVEKFGPLKRISAARTEKAGKYQAVYVRTEFDKEAMEAKVVLDEEDRIAGLFFVPVAEYRVPSYLDATAFTEVEVRVGTGQWVLPGTLSLPKGDGPFPAVALVHGSGPHDRDETIGPNKPFRDLAHGLAGRGVAVLRYEKRTKHLLKDLAEIGDRLTVREEVVDDAVAAVEVLAGHDRIDGKRIFVLGHSLGGYLIPRIAGATQRPAGFIILAGSTRPLEDMIVEQTEYILALDGSLSEEDRKQLDKLKEQAAMVKSPELKPTDKDRAFFGAPAAYWVDLRGYDPPREGKAVTKPMLILQGDRDYQVTAVDFERWKAALGGREDVKLIAYPALNHLFAAGKGKGTPNEYFAAGNVAEEVIKDIAAWVRGR